MYLEIFLADFAVFSVLGGISRDFAEMPEFRGSATTRNIRSPGHNKTSNFPEQTADAFCWLFMLIGNPFSLTGLATKLLLIQFHFVDEYMCSSII